MKCHDRSPGDGISLSHSLINPCDKSQWCWAATLGCRPSHIFCHSRNFTGMKLHPFNGFLEAKRIHSSELLMFGEIFRALSWSRLGSRGSSERENLRLQAAPCPGMGCLRSSPLKLAPFPWIRLCLESPRLTLNRKRKLTFVLAHRTPLPFSLFPKQTSSNRFPEGSTFGMTMYYRPFRHPPRSTLPSFPVSWCLPSSS